MPHHRLLLREMIEDFDHVGTKNLHAQILIERVPKTYVVVGLGFARSVLLPKLLLITSNSEAWGQFAYQNNRRNESNHLRVWRELMVEGLGGHYRRGV